MGYRSDVFYTIRFNPVFHASKEDKLKDPINTVEQLKGAFEIFLQEAMTNEDTKRCFFENELTTDIKSGGLYIDREKCAIYFHAYSVKWYPDYEDVRCHEDLIQLAIDWANGTKPNQYQQYIGCACAKVGEDLADIDEQYVGNVNYDWVVINRQIVCDWS